MIRELCPSLVQWLREDSAPCPLWRLELSGPDGARLEVEAGDASHIARADIDARTDESGLRHLSFRAAVRDGWTVTRVDFPVVSGISNHVARTVAVPAGWGLEYDLEPGMRWEGVYPSCMAEMGFVAFVSPHHPRSDYHTSKCTDSASRPHPRCGPTGPQRSPLPREREQAVLYVGLHDPHGGHKTLRVSAGDEGASFECSYWPSMDESAGGAFELPFEVVIGTVEGGWWQAAQVYRQFTFSADWSGAGPVSARPIPEWLKDTDLWLRIKPELCPQTDPDTFIRAAEFFGVPTAVHWYRWHQIPYDTLYPEYFPARKGFVEGIRQLQSAGIHVMPYINGRLCDPESPTWNDEGGSNWAARDENGEPYTEIYGSKVPLNAMCPHTQFWQDKIGGLVDKLTHECGVDGVYIDQIACAAGLRCFSSNHGHAPGGGRFWVEGYRKLLERVRSALPGDRILTTEEGAECWIDQFDALLMVNTPPLAGTRPIALFPAVYSGRSITFGFQYLTEDDLKQGLPFRYKMANAFVFGAQLGWVTAGWIMAPEAAEEAEFLRSLAHCRRRAHQFVVTGRFMGMLGVEGDNPTLRCRATGFFGGFYDLETPAVIGSRWLAEDGSVGVLLANLDDEAHDVVLAPRVGFASPGAREVRVPERGALAIDVAAEG